MDITELLRNFFILAIIVIGNMVEAAMWVDSLTRYIVEDSGVRQVQLITNMGKDPKIPEIEKIFVDCIGNIPTMRMEMMEGNDWREEEPIPDLSTFDTSPTLFAIVDESRDATTILPAKKTIDNLARKSLLKPRKFLLILISKMARDSLEELLRYVWTQRLLDFTIVELIEPEETKNPLRAEKTFVKPIVHHWNPFREEYMRRDWSEEVTWFPRKATNMWGYQLKIAVSDRPPFSRAKFNSVTLRPYNVRGANPTTVKTIADHMNFTIRYVATSKFMELKRDRNHIGVYNLMNSGKVDILAYLSPHYSDSLSYINTRTTTIRIDSLCPVVPNLPSKPEAFGAEFLEGYIECIVIVGVVTLLRVVFKLTAKIWHPFNIVSVLIGVGITRQPTRNVERSIFVSLLIVSAIYSSNIYSSLTHMSLKKPSSMEIRSFADLDKTGLTPIVSTFLYNKTFEYPDKALLSLKNKIVLGNPDKCPDRAAKHKNVMCLLRKAEAIVIIQSNEKLEKSLKIVEPCFWSDSTSFLLVKGSPYRSYIDDVITRLANSGLLEKWYGDDDNKKSKKIDDGDDDDDDDDEEEDEYSKPGTTKNMMALVHQLMSIMIIGYSASFVAFIAEIVVKRVTDHLRQKSKSRESLVKFDNTKIRSESLCS